MGELQALHAADIRAVGVVVLVAAAHAVDDRHRFGLGHAIAQDHIAIGWPGGIAHALKFHAGEHIGQPPVAVLRDASRIKQIVACGQNDIADIDLNDLVLLLEVNGVGLGGAEYLTGFTFAALEVDAVVGIDDRVFRHSLRESRSMALR